MNGPQIFSVVCIFSILFFLLGAIASDAYWTHKSKKNKSTEKHDPADYWKRGEDSPLGDPW